MSKVHHVVKEAPNDSHNRVGHFKGLGNINMIEGGDSHRNARTNPEHTQQIVPIGPEHRHPPAKNQRGERKANFGNSHVTGLGVDHRCVIWW